MFQSTMRWTTGDLELLPENDDRYEIIDGELLVTRSPHWNHQKLCLRLLPGFTCALRQLFQ